MKKGLILEGGGMRGIFSAGVMDVLMENKIDFDGIIGVSAGAAFGVNYKSGQKGRAIRYNMRYCNDKRYCGMGSLIQTGNLFNTEFCYGEVPLKLDVFDFEAYKNNPADFYLVCTDIESGKAVYHKYTGLEDNGFDWIRASASLPFVSKIVEIDGQKLLDGGITDSIPVEYFEGMGYIKNVAILTQPVSYRKTPNRLMPLIRLKYKKYPALIKAIETRHIMYNHELDYVKKREQDGGLFVIRPKDTLPVGRVEHDAEVLYKTYETGRKTAEEHLQKLAEYLDENG